MLYIFKMNPFKIFFLLSTIVFDNHSKCLIRYDNYSVSHNLYFHNYLDGVFYVPPLLVNNQTKIAI